MRTLARSLVAVALFVAARSLDAPVDRSLVNSLPEQVRQKLTRQPPARFDQPAAAEAFFDSKRLAGVPVVDPRLEYALASGPQDLTTSERSGLTAPPTAQRPLPPGPSQPASETLHCARTTLPRG